MAANTEDSGGGGGSDGGGGNSGLRRRSTRLPVAAMTMMTTTTMVRFVVVVVLWFCPTELFVRAQTEGDTGYDYNDAYEEEYEDESPIGMEPIFDVPIVNVTVVKGQTAVLPCSIDYLNKYKVAWLDYHSIPLTYEDRRVVDDSRFSVVRPLIKEWNLQIRDIRWDDEGQYRCTINTNPVKSKLIMLHVKVPPEIVSELSSDDVITVQEGDAVALTCNVTGFPLPSVTWERLSGSAAKAGSVPDNQACKYRITGPESGPSGATLIIDQVMKCCDDFFECTASNGVPPNVSRRIKLTVEFAPRITMPNKRIGQMKGRETILECIVTAFPHASTYWEKDEKRITSSMKHRIEAYEEGDHTLTLSLRIHVLDSSDFGDYKCVAANSLGRDEDVMHLHEYRPTESIELRTPFLLPDGGPGRGMAGGLLWPADSNPTHLPAVVNQHNYHHHHHSTKRLPNVDHNSNNQLQNLPGRSIYEPSKGRVFDRNCGRFLYATKSQQLLSFLLLYISSKWL